MIDQPIRTVLISIALQLFAVFATIGLYFAG